MKKILYFSFLFVTVCLFYLIYSLNKSFADISQKIDSLCTSAILYAPWRSEYRKTEHQGCPFCYQSKANKDSEFFILKRGKHSFVLQNRYPYAEGHLLVVPYAHVSRLDLLDLDAQHEIIELVSQSCKILQQAFDCKGMNVGINLGAEAGASIPGHLHIHVLPRMSSASFNDSIFGIRVVTMNLQEVYDKLLPCFS